MNKQIYGCSLVVYLSWLRDLEFSDHLKSIMNLQNFKVYMSKSSEEVYSTSI